MFCKCSVFSLREEFFTDFQEESLHVGECKTGFPIFKKKLCEAFERVSCYKCKRFWLKTSSNNILVILEGGSPSAQIQCILNFKLFQGGCYGSGASVCVCVCKATNKLLLHGSQVRTSGGKRFFWARQKKSRNKNCSQSCWRWEKNKKKGLKQSEMQCLWSVDLCHRLVYCTW